MANITGCAQKLIKLIQFYYNTEGSHKITPCYILSASVWYFVMILLLYVNKDTYVRFGEIVG